MQPFGFCEVVCFLLYFLFTVYPRIYQSNINIEIENL